MENIDVSNFLNLHSLGNHEDFCLAYVFTYRDFTGGTLGLAWVASASGEWFIFVGISEHSCFAPFSVNAMSKRIFIPLGNFSAD